MNDITINTASTAEDLDAVRKLCWDYRTFLLDHSGMDRQITETFYPVPKYQALMDTLAEAHARPEGLILLARDADGEAVACGMSHALFPDTSEIKRVFVTDAARGTGIAARICEMLVDQARKDGFDRMVLDTSKSLKAAERLYLRLGFTPRGPYQPIPDDVVDELLFFEMDLRGAP